MYGAGEFLVEHLVLNDIKAVYSVPFIFVVIFILLMPAHLQIVRYII